MTPSPRRAAIILLTSTLVFVQAGAQRAGAAGAEQMGQAITRAEIIVTDRNGRPVSDLEGPDFSLLQNGEPQELTDFRAVDLQVEDRDIDDDSSRVTGEVATNAPMEDGRAFMFLVDELHINTAADGRQRLGTLLSDFLRALSPRDDVAMVSIPDMSNGYVFSRDLGTQFRALDQVQTDVRLVSGRTDWNDDMMATLKAVETAIESMTGTGHLRRVIVLISNGVNILARGSDPRLQPVMAQVARINGLARQAGILLYTIDPRGSIGVSVSDSDTAFVDRIVMGTGGRVVYNPPNLREVPRAVVTENSRFYALEYQLAAATERRLGFALKDDRLQARITFTPDRAFRPVSAASAASVLAVALESPLDRADVELQVSVAETGPGADGRVDLGLAIEVHYPAAGRDMGNDELLVRVVALDATGQEVGRHEATRPVELPADPTESARHAWTETVALSPGQATLRVGVFSPVMAAIGTVSLAVDVPGGSVQPPAPR